MATVTAAVPDLSGDNLTSWLQSEHKTLLDLVQAAWGITLQFDLAVSFREDTITISFQHNPAVIASEQARMIAATAARAVAQIVRHANSIISDLDLVSETDIARISQWNSISNKEIGRAKCIHQVISVTASSQPSTTAVSSWDGELTYGELERLSSALAVSLRHLGVRREIFVPLIFDKSKWAIVAMLGVLKAGGAYFFLNPTHPVQYNKTLCKPFDIKLAVCSPKHHTLAQSFAPRFVELGSEAGKDLEVSSLEDESPLKEESQETPSPSQAMYATFTSGTTGTPKSITTSHDAFYHMAMATASPSALHISPSTRMLQFASYTFDVANRDILIPLMLGGCVCVPSERERVEDLGGFIERTGVTLASLTPSMAGTLRPASVPSLERLVLGGEQMTESHVQSWTSDEDNKVVLFNAYGVSESTGIAALAQDVRLGGDSSPSNIGRGNGSTLWVLSMIDPSRLAPVGALAIRELARRQTRMSGVGGEQAGSEITTTAEKILVQAWSKILDINEEGISREDCFFRRGGDSIAAIKLAAHLRENRIQINVEDVFKYSTLADMAALPVLAQGVNASTALSQASSQPSAVPPPFSLLKAPQSIIPAILEEVGLSREKIEDIYPATHIQAGLIALTAQHSVEIAVDGKSPLVRLYLSKEAFRLDIHHALFDEWSLDLILEQVEKAYAGQYLPYRPFSPFVQNLLTQEQNLAADEFWRESFAGLRIEHFPPGSSITSSTVEKVILEHTLSLDPTMTSAHSKYTLSTTLRLAWGIILSNQTDSPDVVFGATVTGRNADNLELTGPTLATLPVRVKVPGDQAIHTALGEAQKGFADMMAHQQTGLSRIRAVSGEAADACGFQNLLVVQQQTAKTDNQQSSPSSIFETSASIGGSKSPDNAKAFASYPLVLTCRPSQHSIAFTAAVDPTLLDTDTTRGILRQMAHVVQQILSSTSSDSSPEAHDLRIKDIDLMPRQDVERLRKWNRTLPAGSETPIHHTIRKKAGSQPEKVAVHSHGLNLSYEQVERYSNLFSQHLCAAGVNKGDFVPLLLERSPWAPVLMLAVLKLGAAFALLDLSHPVQRLRTMCTVLSARRVVCFPHHRTMVENDLLLPEVVFDPEVITDVSKSTRDAPAGLAEIDMNAPACVVFSSGSTGLPKAIQLTHRALSTSAYHLSTTGHLSQCSRVFNFSSFAFDLSIGELLFSLSAGATVCVPTEEERRANPSKAAGDLGVTWALLTPSVIGLLDPEEVPTLQVLASAGEQLTSQIVERWAGRVKLFNMYAPAECTVISHISRILPGADTPPACIGRSPGAVSWVASQNDHHKLVPIGTIGELLVEGPVVSAGYLGDAVKTDAVFLSPSNPPSWLTQIRGKIGRVYKTGDLVRQREDGTLLFVGRKDDQIKLHGQRLEVEEVELSITSLCSSVRKVAVDCVRIAEKGGGQRAFLVAFVAPHEFEDWGEVGKEGGLEVIQDPNDNFYNTIESLYTSLQDTLPSYMLPSYFLPFLNIPLSLSGKVNRKLLREESTNLLSSQDHREKYQLRTRTAREQAADGKQVSLTEHETQILQIIAQVLHLDAQQVPINGNFFGIGGDSISAMRVAALARRNGLRLGVVEIFKHQILSQIAASCCPESDTDSTTPDFSESSSTTDATSQDSSESLSNTDSNSEKALGCEIPPGVPQEVAQQVELGLPATDFQTMTLYNFYSRYLWISLPDNIDTERLQQACQLLTEKHSILRTVFYTTTTTTAATGSVVQLVLRSFPVDLKHHKDIESLEQHFTSDSLSHGPPVNGAEGFQVQLLSLRDGQKKYLALRLPHAQFDGLSLNVLVDDLSAAYDDNTGHSLAPCAQFSDQVKCVTETKTTDEAYQVWKDVLDDAEMTRLDGQILRHGDGVERTEEGEESVQELSVVTAMTETAPLVAPAGITMATGRMAEGVWSSAKSSTAAHSRSPTKTGSWGHV
ncbi:Nonribosomal peptide synthase chyA [Colletotrichum sp. SAR 10_75]|nr:Nonribosomal peptide synthase chyA [Colletotrichum sp. SAR 10_75]